MRTNLKKIGRLGISLILIITMFIGMIQPVEVAAADLDLPGQHTADIADLLPVVGEPLDAINAAIYLAQGDNLNAGLSAASMIPVVGSLGIVAKGGNKVSKAVEAGTKGVTKGSGWTRMTTKQATGAAKKLGYEPTNYTVKNGEKVFYNKKTKTYISHDIGSGDASGPHNGGVWKMAKSPEAINSKSTRMGTYDANLNRIGD